MMMVDWGQWRESLLQSPLSNVEDIGDELAGNALALPPDPTAVPVLIMALERVQAELTQVRVAAALAWCALPDDTAVSDCLLENYKKYKKDPFRGSAFINALSFLSIRSPLARNDLKGQLLRLSIEDSRYLLLAGIKAIALLCSQQPDTELQWRLKILSTSQDPSVTAESLHQLALLDVANCLSANNDDDLLQGLSIARTAFSKAEMAEEQRIDSTFFVCLLDLIILFGDPANELPCLRKSIAEAALRLKKLILYFNRHGYDNEFVRHLSAHASSISEALQNSSVEISKVDRWTNFDKSMAQLARAYSLIHPKSVLSSEYKNIESVVATCADAMFRRRVGPLVMRKLGRESLAEVVTNYKFKYGEDFIFEGLDALTQELFALEYTRTDQVSAECLRQMEQLARSLKRTPDEIIAEMWQHIQQNSVAGWAKQHLRPASDVSVVQTVNSRCKDQGMTYKLRILHISDLHERGSREQSPWRRRRVFGESWNKGLDEFLEEGPIDLVCFTGDMADWGKEDEYAPVTDFIQAILERLGLSLHRLFMVPGNHDIDRGDKGSVNRRAWRKLRKSLAKAEPLAVSRWLIGGEPPNGLNQQVLEYCLARQDTYHRWLEKGLGRPELLPGKSLHGRLGYCVPINIPGHPFPIQVIGLNSAWLAGDEADSGNLLLTDEQIMRLACTATGERHRGYNLALMHHPLSDLMDRGEAQRLLADHVDLLLRGHLHDPQAEIWNEPTRKLPQFAAGCLYEGHGADRFPNSCHVVEVNLDSAGRAISYNLHFRSWSPRGHWHDDNSLYPGTRNGRLIWSA